MDLVIVMYDDTMLLLRKDFNHYFNWNLKFSIDLGI